MLFYRAAVDLSRPTLNYVAGIVRRHRRAIRSRWRLLNPGQQALLVLVHLRKGETFVEAAAGFGVSVATAWRYVEEIVALLSARSPKLRAALRKVDTDGLTHLVLNGTLIHTDRMKADHPHFSGKHRVHGMNVQVIAGPDGTVLWTLGAMPGKIHDLTATRVWGILRALHKMRPMLVVEDLELTKGMEQMPLVPDQSPFEQFTAAGLHSPFHHRGHPRHPHSGGHHPDAGIDQGRVEQLGELAAAVTDQEPCPATGVLQANNQVPGRLHQPRGGRMGGGAQDADPAAVVFDDR